VGVVVEIVAVAGVDDHNGHSESLVAAVVVAAAVVAVAAAAAEFLVVIAAAGIDVADAVVQVEVIVVVGFD
jgi:hypothetical protein